MKKWVILVTIAVLILFAGFTITKPNDFDAHAFDGERIYATLTKLTKAPYLSRQTGTTQNQLTMDYVQSELLTNGLSLKEQPFRAQVPFFEASSIFNFLDAEKEPVSLVPYKDYKFVAWGPGGSADYEGDLIFTDNNPYKFPEGYFKDKIVVTRGNPLIGDSLKLMEDTGAKGVLYYSETDLSQPYMAIPIQSLMLFDKPGNTMAVGFISREVFASLKKIAMANPIEPDEILPTGTVYGVVPDVKLKQPIEIKTIDTKNLIGIIPGKSKRVTVFTCDLDDSGDYTSALRDQIAVSEASAMANALELSRVYALSGQPEPDETLLFAFLNASQTDYQGFNALIEGLLNGDIDGIAYAPEAITVIDLRQVGGGSDQDEEVLFSWRSGEKGTILESNFLQHASDLNVEVSSSRSPNYTIRTLAQHGIKGISVSFGSPKQLNSVISAWSGETHYDVNPWLVLNAKERLVLLILAIYLFAMYAAAIFKESIPQLTMSTPFLLLKSLGGLLTPVTIIALLILITKLPRNFNVVFEAGTFNSNFSMTLTLKHALQFIRGFDFENIEFLLLSARNSFILFGAATLFAIIVGVAKGLFDAYNEKQDSALRSFVSLTILSVPEIMWILVANRTFVAISKIVPVPELKGFVFPWLILAIMPTVYISRMAYLTFMKERQKPYYMALSSRGIPKRNLYLRHMMPPVLEVSFASLTGLISVMVSNLIIVEFLFDYKGLANFVLIADKTKDEVTFVSMIAAISILYMTYVGIYKFLGAFSNVKRRGGKANV